MSKFEIFNKISETAVSLPFLMSFNLKSLIKGLLEKSDAKRYEWEHVSKCAWLSDVSYCTRLLL